MSNELDCQAAALRPRSYEAVAAIYGTLAEVVTGLGALGEALAGAEPPVIERAVDDVVTAWTFVLAAIDALDDALDDKIDDTSEDLGAALGRARRALPAAAAVVDQLFDRALGLPDQGVHGVLERLQCETRILLGGGERVLRPEDLADVRPGTGRRMVSREYRRRRGA